MVNDMLDPGEIRVAARRRAEAPARIAGEALAAPVGDVEGRVGEDEIRLQVRVTVVEETVAMRDLAVDAADGEVHLRQPPCGVVGFLAPDADVAAGAAAIAVAGRMSLDEIDRLDEHSGRAAARVVDAALPGFEHFDEQAHDAARGVEFAALASETRKEILVDAAERVAGARFGVADADPAHQVDQPAQPPPVERRAGVVARQHPGERRVVALHRRHGVLHRAADIGLPRPRRERRPARLRGNPEDVFGAVFVGVFRVRALGAFADQAGAGFPEGVGDVFEEDQAEHHVLVFGGVHRAAQRVGRFPQFGFVAGDGAVCFLRLLFAALRHETRLTNPSPQHRDRLYSRSMPEGSAASPPTPRRGSSGGRRAPAPRAG